MSSVSSGATRGNLEKTFGFSIRLVRPATTYELSLADGTTSNTDSSLPHYIGNSITYITVKIGNQVWTTQNLIDTSYNNGVVIPEVTVDATWFGLTTGARCSYNNGSITPDQGQITLCGVPITPTPTPTETPTPTATPTPTPTPTETPPLYLLLFEDGSIATAENNDNLEIDII
jgi:hypothetical protein